MATAGQEICRILGRGYISQIILGMIDRFFEVFEASIPLFIAIVVALLGYKIYQRQSIYNRKQDAIKNALMLLNDFYSVLEFDSKVVPVRDEKVTKEYLTLKARECYEDLCVSCKRKTVPTLFAEIIFAKEGRTVGLLADFRDAARKELGLRKIEQDKSKVFFSIVSSELLENLPH